MARVGAGLTEAPSGGLAGASLFVSDWVRGPVLPTRVCLSAQVDNDVDTPNSTLVPPLIIRHARDGKHARARLVRRASAPSCTPLALRRIRMLVAVIVGLPTHPCVTWPRRSWRLRFQTVCTLSRTMQHNLSPRTLLAPRHSTPPLSVSAFAYPLPRVAPTSAPRNVRRSSPRDG